jgi:hypothetical protein
MSAHAQKAKRNQIAAVADELAIAGVHEWCVRDTTGRTSGHVLIDQRFRVICRHLGQAQHPGRIARRPAHTREGCRHIELTSCSA